MDHESTLRSYGLFDAKVPRYTSFPPANRFEPETGRRNHLAWLSALPQGEPVSLYMHIPFCRRLCWFCACRTQGTKTLKPVSAYVTDLIAEVQHIAACTPGKIPMARLHLGGGTPTLLSGADMQRLLTAVFDAFPTADAFEFSVEIDPTEASPEVLETLSAWGMTRASIGVQDFEPAVQAAIGREQSFSQTLEVVEALRDGGVRSLNVDLLYGLPYQTAESLTATLDKVVSLRPDRLALYGYAHVPHMSKRQVMISEAALPRPEARFSAACLTHDRLVALGYTALGIDHFALPSDSLAQAARAGRMRRNFQGYTDDPCATLLGLGASAISQFRQGFVQNAVSTAAYRARVQETGTAGHKGYVLTAQDGMVSEMIEGVLCRGVIDAPQVAAHHPEQSHLMAPLLAALEARFPKALKRIGDTLTLLPDFEALARIIAADLDRELRAEHIHSSAI